MVFRKHPEELADKRPVLDAMGRCRKVVTDAMHSVRPFGLTHRALSLVKGAIDTAAWFLTGSETYYHAGNSAPSMELGKWRDSGSDR